MADTKISDLPTLTTPADEDVIPIVDDPTGTPVTKKVTVGSLAPVFSGALVQLSGDQTISNATLTPVSWDAEIYDVGDWWDVGAPTRFTVPADVTRVRLVANIMWEADVMANRILEIHKDGALIDGSPRTNVLTNTVGGSACILNICSPVLVVSPTEYFELKVQQGSGGDLDVLSNAVTWFGIEKVT